MTGAIDARLAELGIDLPEAPAPAANYVPWVVTGNLVFIAGTGAVPGRQAEPCRQAGGNAFTVRGRPGLRAHRGDQRPRPSSRRLAAAISTG